MGKRSVYIPCQVSSWFDETFEKNDESSIKKEYVYGLYCNYCSKNNIAPVKNNIFAKMVKNKFPRIKSRRLGSRGKGVPYFQGFKLKKYNLSEKMQWEAAHGIVKLICDN
jgi:hypothetical protein